MTAQKALTGQAVVPMFLEMLMLSLQSEVRILGPPTYEQVEEIGFSPLQLLESTR